MCSRSVTKTWLYLESILHTAVISFATTLQSFCTKRHLAQQDLAGQHFLIADDVLQAIVTAVTFKTDLIVEIGPASASQKSLCKKASKVITNRAGQSSSRSSSMQSITHQTDMSSPSSIRTHFRQNCRQIHTKSFTNIPITSHPLLRHIFWNPRSPTSHAADSAKSPKQSVIQTMPAC